MVVSRGRRPRLVLAIAGMLALGLVPLAMAGQAARAGGAPASRKADIVIYHPDGRVSPPPSLKVE